MSAIIDRRKNGKNKSSENREKFLRRYKQSIAEAVKKGVASRKISDVDSKGVDITIDRKSISEPSFQHDFSTGIRQGVNPGNTKYQTGDKIRKPPEQQGQGSGSGNGGDGEDGYTFSISKEEFIDYFFKDMELPNMIKETLTGSNNFSLERAGFSTVGIPANLDLPRTMKTAIGRRFALKGFHDREIVKLQLELEELENIRDRSDEQDDRLQELRVLIENHSQRSSSVPFIDDFDLRFKQHKRIPKPTRRAVMFCVMDVSGSMGEHEKDLAKRFYVLLYLFLSKVYEQIDIRYVRYHHEAREVSEDEFFYAKDTGGTLVSTGFDLINDIITQDYPSQEWNVYVAQTSDGDNWMSDNAALMNILDGVILPKIQHFAYLQVASDGDFRSHVEYLSELWELYEERLVPKWASKMDMKKLMNHRDVGEIFKELYQKRTK